MDVCHKSKLGFAKHHGMINFFPLHTWNAEFGIVFILMCEPSPAHSLR